MDRTAATEQHCHLAQQYFDQARTARAPEEQAFWTRLGEQWLRLAGREIEPATGAEAFG
jgi:hypothetical protein